MIKNNKMPKVVRERLNVYIKILKKYKEQGYDGINSVDLAQEFTNYEIDSSTVRRDFSYLGKLGRNGYGYNIDDLIEKLTHEIGIGNKEDIILFGVGNMGKALLKYNLLNEKVGRIVAAFDINKEEDEILGVPIYNYSEFGQTNIPEARIAIIAVSTSQAQDVVDKAIKYGVKAIINFSDADLIIKSKKVIIKNIDLAYFIQEVVYSLKINNLK